MTNTRSQAPVGALKWQVALIALALFGAWQAINHWGLMRAPMSVQHALAFWVEVTIALCIAFLVYWTLSRYQCRLEALNAHLKRQNRELEELHQQRDELTAMIVHDLRSPLSTILGVFHLLDRQCEAKDNEVRELIGTASETGITMLAMINSLLDVTRLEAGEMPLDRSRVAVGEVVDQVIKETRLLAEQKQLALHALAPALPVWLDADREVIRRVLHNLVSNAIKFTPPAGSITLRWYAASTPGWAEMVVEDSGPGIPPAHQQMVFEKFGTIQARREGEARMSTGLGLTFCKLAVEAHGGRIWIESGSGQGSSFFWTCPVTDEQVPAIRHEESRHAVPQGHGDHPQPGAGDGRASAAGSGG